MCRLDHTFAWLQNAEATYTHTLTTHNYQLNINDQYTKSTFVKALLAHNNANVNSNQLSLPLSCIRFLMRSRGWVKNTEPHLYTNMTSRGKVLLDISTLYMNISYRWNLRSGWFGEATILWYRCPGLGNAVHDSGYLQAVISSKQCVIGSWSTLKPTDYLHQEYNIIYSCLYRLNHILTEVHMYM